MLQFITVDANSSPVFRELRPHFGKGFETDKPWGPHTVERGDAARLIRVDDSGRPTCSAVTWGRAGREGDKRYLEDTDPSRVQRGVIVASSFRMLQQRTTNWGDYYDVRFSAPWVLIGCAWDGNLRDGPTGLAVLVKRHGVDAQGKLAFEPVLVPLAGLRNWLAPGPGANLSFPPPPGTFKIDGPHETRL